MNEIIANATHEQLYPTTTEDAYAATIHELIFGIGELGRTPETTALDELEAVAIERAQGTTRDMVRCGCGHTVARSLVMSASLGTCCPNCYDRLSD